MSDEARETKSPFKPERTTTRIRNRNNPQRMRKRYSTNRRVPLRTKIAGLAGAAVLTAFGGAKIADKVFSNTGPEEPGIVIQLDPSASQARQERGNQASQYIFNDLTSQEAVDVDKMTAQMDEVILGNPSFNEMVQVVAELEPLIDASSKKHGIPASVAYGMVLIENGGGHDLVSPAGAVGPTQLMRDAAIEMGLKVDDEVDERLIPEKAIPAMFGYIAKYRDLFGGNLGISVWNYHAGPGNVGEALRLYFLDTEEIDIGELDFKVYGDLIKQRKLSVHRLLSNPRVIEQLLSRLEDETELYPAKAAAGAQLYESEKAKNLADANIIK